MRHKQRGSFFKYSRWWTRHTAAYVRQTVVTMTCSMNKYIMFGILHSVEFVWLDEYLKNECRSWSYDNTVEPYQMGILLFWNLNNGSDDKKKSIMRPFDDAKGTFWIPKRRKYKYIDYLPHNNQIHCHTFHNVRFPGEGIFIWNNVQLLEFVK